MPASGGGPASLVVAGAVDELPAVVELLPAAASEIKLWMSVKYS